MNPDPQSVMPADMPTYRVQVADSATHIRRLPLSSEHGRRILDVHNIDAVSCERIAFDRSLEAYANKGKTSTIFI
jgi:hypothetical protein